MDKVVQQVQVVLVLLLVDLPVDKEMDLVEEEVVEQAVLMIQMETAKEVLEVLVVLLLPVEVEVLLLVEDVIEVTQEVNLQEEAEELLLMLGLLLVVMEVQQEVGLQVVEVEVELIWELEEELVVEELLEFKEYIFIYIHLL